MTKSSDKVWKTYGGKKLGKLFTIYQNIKITISDNGFSLLGAVMTNLLQTTSNVNPYTDG